MKQDRIYLSDVPVNRTFDRVPAALFTIEIYANRNIQIVTDQYRSVTDLLLMSELILSLLRV